MPSREELNQLYSDSHKLKQVIADNKALHTQLAQQAELVEKCMVCMNDNADEAKRLEAVIAELQAALAEPSEPSEPYAWELFFHNGKSNGFTTDKYEAAEFGEYKQPLFTHPATSKPAPLPELTREELLGAIARGWCTERNAYKTMDVELAEDIAEAVWEKLE